MDTKPYVFISYAHVNSDYILPCIESLKKSGINLWYDEGIEAGSEWPEYIAEKVISCSKFVLFISNAYINSQNCKRELNFAISRKKEILSIFIEDVNLSPGMEMQLGTYQAIYTNRFDGKDNFFKYLSGERFFDVCRYEQPENQVQLQSSNDTQQNQSTEIEFPDLAKLNETAYVQSENKQNTKSDILPASRYTAALLALFLGFIGIHKFYLKQHNWGIIYIVLCWTYVPLAVGIVEFFILLFGKNDLLKKIYKRDFKK